MTDPHAHTDLAWEEWGRKDPYFGVITNAKFRRAEMTPEAKHEFIESGRVHADYVLAMIRQHIAPDFVAQRVLDFGCGVGRLAIPLARLAAHVTGVDVSRSMLDEAAKNCAEYGAANVALVQSDDTLSTLEGTFDLVHSYIVFQHIPPERGRALFARLLDRIQGGGIGALHFLYSKQGYAGTLGVVPPPAPPAAPPPGVPAKARAPAEAAPPPDPEMQMNAYGATEILFAIQQAGILRFHAEFTDHGGELGLFLFFRKP